MGKMINLESEGMKTGKQFQNVDNYRISIMIQVFPSFNKCMVNS